MNLNTRSVKKGIATLAILTMGLFAGVGVSMVTTPQPVQAACEQDICDVHNGVGHCQDSGGAVDQGCDMTGANACTSYDCTEGGGNGLYPRRKY